VNSPAVRRKSTPFAAQRDARWERAKKKNFHHVVNRVGGNMAVVKVVELLAESNKSWEDAASEAVTKASKTVHGIKSIYIKDLEAKVENNKITAYRINAKVSFTLD